MNLWWLFGLIEIINAIYIPEVVICKQDDLTADCSNAQLNEIPETVNHNISNLDLSRNEFEHIPPTLSKFHNLQYLNFSCNKISTLGYADFSEMVNLESLDLTFNLFHDWKDLMADAFKPLQKLKFLDLSSNPLRTMAQYSHHFDLRSLEILKLDNCSLFNIYPESFDGANSLKQLHLSHNPVQVINGSFNLTNVKLLDLSHCSIQYLNPRVFQALKALEILRLHHNRYLRSLIFNSNSLSVLDLSDCNLESVPMGSLETVTELKLEGNFLTTLSENGFVNYPNLLTLNLSINAISNIHQNAFRGLDNLRKMDLSENKITSISEKVFLPTIMLEKLILSRNYIRKIDNITSSSIEILDVSYCEIYSVSAHSLANLPKLKRLSLSRNFIANIPDGWSADRLYYLDLSNCRIRAINNRTFEKMSNLRTIDLSGNQLTSVESSNFLNAFYVKLEDNPWKCDCPKLEEIYYWLIASGQNTDTLICDSPAKSQGYNWEEACNKEWNLSGSKSKQIWWYSVVVIGSLTLLLATIMVLKKLNEMKENRLRQADEQRRAHERDAREALERMQRLQRDFIEEADRNAPDPREYQSPPSYTDALLMPRLDASHPSLAGSLHSITGSNSSLNKKGKIRRKRRRRRSEKSEDGKRQSRASLNDSDTSDTERPNHRPPLESDF